MKPRDKLDQMKEAEEHNRQHEEEWRKKQMETKKIQLSRAEQETCIVWDAEEKVAHIYASDPVSIRKLDALCAEHPETYRCIWVDPLGVGVAKKYEAPADRIRFAKPASEAQRESGRKLAEKIKANSNP